MTRISNAEHVLLLLRNHLERMRKTRGKRASVKGKDGRDRTTPLHRLEHLASVSDLSEPELQRALIEAVLADEFGADVSNDARFQGIVSEVLSAISKDDRASALLRDACRTLSTP